MNSSARAVASGAKWVALAQGSRLAAQVLNTAILARLLSPSDFGIIAMASAVAGFAGIFRDFGTVAAVIQRRDLGTGLLDSVFWLNVAIGVGIAISLTVLAPAVAFAMQQPKLAVVLPLLALAFPIIGVGLVQQALLERASRFRPIALIEGGAAFTGLATGALAALAGWGLYSLILQTLIAATAATAGLWTASAWRPSRRWSVSEIRELTGFGANLTGFNMFNYIARNVDSILIGRFLGATDLGYYSVAYRIMLLPLQSISWAVGRALLPTLSRLQDDHQRLCQGYLRAAAAAFLLTAPLTVGLLVLREPLVAAVLGEKWHKVSDLLFWLAPVSVVQCVVTSSGWLYLSTGRTDIMFKFAVVNGVVDIGAFLIGLRWGVEGVAAGYCIATLIAFWPALAIPFRLVGLSLVRFLRHLAPTLFAAGLMALVVVAAATASVVIALPPWPRLVFLTALGGVSYAVVSMLVQRPILKDVTSTLLCRRG